MWQLYRLYVSLGDCQAIVRIEALYSVPVSRLIITTQSYKPCANGAQASERVVLYVTRALEDDEAGMDGRIRVDLSAKFAQSSRWPF